MRDKEDVSGFISLLGQRLPSMQRGRQAVAEVGGRPMNLEREREKAERRREGEGRVKT